MHGKHYILRKPYKSHCEINDIILASSLECAGTYQVLERINLSQFQNRPRLPAVTRMLQR